MIGDGEDDTLSAPANTPKADPESLELRARPARAIRFKRGAVIAVAAIASASVIATTWVALKPAAFHIVADPDDRAISAKAPADTLSALPASYGDAPKLGAPLPGDLGRPILDRQRSMATETGTTAGPTAAQAEDQARERRAAQVRAARESGLLFSTSAKPAAVGEAAPVAPAILAGPDSARPQADTERDPNGQLRKNELVNGSDRASPFDPHTLIGPVSPYTLSAGSVIAASLITGLRSDVPGLVTAQVTERVFDSATGRIELIPQGARLVGMYDSVVAFGQKRALVVWQRIVMPDGCSIQIENVPATDPGGYAGLADKVDFHTWTLLKGVALSTLLGVGSSLTLAGESDLIQALRESTQQNVARAGDQLTSKNLQVQPTITVRPGSLVRLVLHRDLILAPWRR